MEKWITAPPPGEGSFRVCEVGMSTRRSGSLSPDTRPPLLDLAVFVNVLNHTALPLQNFFSSKNLRLLDLNQLSLCK